MHSSENSENGKKQRRRAIRRRDFSGSLKHAPPPAPFLTRVASNLSGSTFSSRSDLKRQTPSGRRLSDGRIEIDKGKKNPHRFSLALSAPLLVRWPGTSNRASSAARGSHPPRERINPPTLRPRAARATERGHREVERRRRKRQRHPQHPRRRQRHHLPQGPFLPSSPAGSPPPPLPLPPRFHRRGSSQRSSTPRLGAPRSLSASATTTTTATTATMTTTPLHETRRR